MNDYHLICEQVLVSTSQSSDDSSDKVITDNFESELERVLKCGEYLKLEMLLQQVTSNK